MSGAEDSADTRARPTDPMLDESREFAAFPATHAGRSFATTWWGKAWVGAVQDTSLDESQLRRGRAYARRGQVGAITVAPGLATAIVRDPSLEAFRVVVRMAVLTDAQWERMVEQVAARSGHLLALLDGQLPAELLADADRADVPLLPGIGDLDPDCECDAWELPCVHAAALSYQVSWLIDADPFVLWLLRGRGTDRLLGELRGRTTAAPVGARATDADAQDEVTPASPEPLPRWDFAPAYHRGDDLPPGPGVDPETMHDLVRAAAARAADLLADQSTA